MSGRHLGFTINIISSLIGKKWCVELKRLDCKDNTSRYRPVVADIKKQNLLVTGQCIRSLFELVYVLQHMYRVF